MSKRTAIFYFLIFFYSNDVYAGNKFSRSSGNWTTTGTWSNSSGGPSCGCIPSSSDIITITHNITLNTQLTSSNGISGTLIINSGGTLNGGSTYDLDIKPTGTLTVNGTLTANNLTFFNGSYITVNSTANVTVNGTLHNKNNSNAVLFNGSVTVLGPFINGSGSVISGVGPLTINTGPGSNAGILFGCNGTIPNSFPITLPGTCSPLPIELISFEAVRINDKALQVTWETASEMNNDYFTLERSWDGSNFFSLAEISASGSTSSTSFYNFTDFTPIRDAFYYRLYQTDFNNVKQFLITFKVKADMNECAKIFQNDSKLTVNLNCELFRLAIIRICDLTGHCLQQEFVKKDSSSNEFTYHLNKGAYVVSLISDNSAINKKIIVF